MPTHIAQNTGIASSQHPFSPHNKKHFSPPTLQAHNYGYPYPSPSPYLYQQKQHPNPLPYTNIGANQNTHNLPYGASPDPASAVGAAGGISAIIRQNVFSNQSRERNFNVNMKQSLGADERRNLGNQGRAGMEYGAANYGEIHASGVAKTPSLPYGQDLDPQQGFSKFDVKTDGTLIAYKPEYSLSNVASSNHVFPSPASLKVFLDLTQFLCFLG